MPLVDIAQFNNPNTIRTSWARINLSHKLKVLKFPFLTHPHSLPPSLPPFWPPLLFFRHSSPSFPVKCARGDAQLCKGGAPPPSAHTVTAHPAGRHVPLCALSPQSYLHMSHCYSKSKEANHCSQLGRMWAPRLLTFHSAVERYAGVCTVGCVYV